MSRETDIQDLAPLVRRLDQLVLKVDSRDRDTTKYTASNDFYINIPQIKNVKEISLVNGSFPVVMPLIHANNNIIYFSDNHGGPYTVNLTVGQYTSTTLETEIGNKMSAASAGTYTAAIDAATNLLTITKSAGSFTLTFNSGLSSTDLLHTARHVLGFDEAAYSSTSQAVTAPNMVNLAGPPSMLLTIGDFPSKIVTTHRQATNKIFAEFYFGTSFGEYNHHNFDYTPIRFEKPVNIHRLHFKCHIPHKDYLYDFSVFPWRLTLNFYIERFEHSKDYVYKKKKRKHAIDYYEPLPF